jgi:dolichol-phosphate mannosyltransferase
MESRLSAIFRPLLVPAALAARTLLASVLVRWPQLRRYGRLIRFGLVGLSGMAVNSAILWVLVTEIGLPLLPASMLATEAAIVSNFLLNDRWTFRDAMHSHAAFQRFLRFNGVAFGGMLITAMALAALTVYAHLHLLMANVLAVGVAMAWNYIVNSRWIWRVTRSLPARSDIGEKIS